MNVWISDHATERFVQRVRPTLEHRDAKFELARLCREFGRLVARPVWLSDRSPDPDFWLAVSDDIVVACSVGPPRKWPVALTVLVRGEVSDRARERRALRRRGRPSHRDVTLASRGREGSRRDGPDVDEWAA
jgi:hypothetical protein